MWGAGAAFLGLFPPRLLPPSASLPYVGFLSKLPTELSSRGLPGAHREMGVGGGGKGVFLALLGNEVGATLRGFPSAGAGHMPANLDCESCLRGVPPGAQWGGASVGRRGHGGGAGRKEERLEQASAPLWWVPYPSAWTYGWPCTSPTWEATGQQIKPWTPPVWQRAGVFDH